ncbi:hypothetical protein AYJ57_21280 (plasmid) [Salipiger sp. CCB-MM3]|uniref:hypothetical protein n=1 Tax=Salipiger sp. CCB-MM3 TaxID=1792508 RepID=UPI00080A9EEF|nr:hypothetical protein [Salipiger sp. CCB-MM3]ANT63010.1 hypothetical protein AYJ57_21280 [Salipiger sp. CCB-MM3]
MLIQQFNEGSLADALAGELRLVYSHFVAVWWTEGEWDSMAVRDELVILSRRLGGILRVYEGKDVSKLLLLGPDEELRKQELATKKLSVLFFIL